MDLLKILQGRRLLILVIAGIALYLFYFSGIINFNFGSSSPRASAPLSSGTTPSAFNLPLHLKIPKINVDAPIEPVGVLPDGSVGVPKGPSEVAWFERSPRPGESGSSIIDGHAGWKNGIPAVFDNLHKLKKGDKIHVEDSAGETTTFVVSKVGKYGPNQYAPDVFGASDSGAHLNLITCTGQWDKIEKSHSDRLVVFADKE